MADITRDYIAEKRKVIQQQIYTLQGALEMLDMIEGDLLPKDSLTFDDLKKATGAVSVDVLPVESEG